MKLFDLTLQPKGRTTYYSKINKLKRNVMMERLDN